MTTTALNATRDAAIRLNGNDGDYDALLEQARDRDFVLLGEASHGTHEFYRMRAEITRRLIEEAGFDAVAVEADWPDALSLNRYAQGGADDEDAAFEVFERFPQWMWRNQDVRGFIGWLRDYNRSHRDSEKAGFFGMDLYSMYRSAQAVVDYLVKVDPEQAVHARRIYERLDHVADPQRYGYEAAFGVRPSQQDEVIALLVELTRDRMDYLARDGLSARDAQFFAEENARVVADAEHYYRAMFGSRVNTWNLRDEHMTDNLFALRRHLKSEGRAGRIVVWAHNSHLGDAACTEMGWRQHEHNVGQLVRERAGQDRALLVGFTTYTGTVAAARRWGGEVERRNVRPALDGSYENLFHRTGLDRFCLPLKDPVTRPLEQTLLERAIGVIYAPETERYSHFFEASLRRQFDMVFHLDETRAVDPLDAGHHWHSQETPDTYPFGV